jgi:hypothetical protein
MVSKENDDRMDLHPTDSDFGRKIEARTNKESKAKTGPAGESTGTVNKGHKSK